MDGLSPRAGHPPENLVAVHGDLWTLRCEKLSCGYSEKNLNDPVVPALEVDDFPKDKNQLPKIPISQLPHCPKCNSLLRPAVVFFNEQLPGLFFMWIILMLVAATDKVDQWIYKQHVDLILVIGTSGTVYPAAGYAWNVKIKGGKVAVFNIEADDDDDYHWMFKGMLCFEHLVTLGPCEELLPQALGVDVASVKL